MKYIDTHCHLLNEYFDNAEIDNLLKEAAEAGVEQIIVPATTWANSWEVINLVQKYRNVYGAIGIHPSETKQIFNPDDLQTINLTKIIAIGEIGLDFYWQDNPSFDTQKKVFEIFLDFALVNNLPALIHMRDSEMQTYEILKQPKYQNLKFVIHSFTSTYEWACKFIDLGGYISFSGIVTFKNASALQLVAQKIPLHKILSETDTPYLTPTPYRGHQNKPVYVQAIVNFIANLRNEENQIVIDTIYENARCFFNL